MTSIACLSSVQIHQNFDQFSAPMLLTTTLTIAVLILSVFVYQKWNARLSITDSKLDVWGMDRLENEEAGPSDPPPPPGIVNFRAAVVSDSNDSEATRQLRKETGDPIAFIDKVKVFRMGVNSPSDADCRRLTEEYGIKTLIDLRLDSERKGDRPQGAMGKYYNLETLDPKRGRKRGRLVHVDMMGRDFQQGIYSTLPLHYKALIPLLTFLRLKPLRNKLSLRHVARQDLFYHSDLMLRNSHKQIREALLSLLSVEDCLPAAVFCSAGKDRTGLISGLLQLLAGYTKEEIVNQYKVSVDNLSLYIPYMSSSMAKSGLNPHTMLDSPSSVMEKLLTALDEVYGGHEKYLEFECGISIDELERLKILLSS